MKGIKYLLFGLMFILIGSAILIDTESYLGGYGETLLFIIGIIFEIKELFEKE